MNLSLNDFVLITIICIKYVYIRSKFSLNTDGAQVSNNNISCKYYVSPDCQIPNMARVDMKFWVWCAVTF